MTKTVPALAIGDPRTYGARQRPDPAPGVGQLGRCLADNHQRREVFSAAGLLELRRDAGANWFAVWVLPMAWSGASRDEGSGLADQSGGAGCRLVRYLSEYGAAGVGCQHDAGVAEHVLDHLQVGAGGRGERRRSGPVVQAYRW